MTESDPLNRLSRVANQSEQPAPEFSARLLDELLSELTADQTGPTGSAFDNTIYETATEVIMLSPEANAPRPRSLVWALVAASVAAIALVGGIVAANRDSDTTDVAVGVTADDTANAPADLETVTLTGDFAGAYSVSYFDGGNGSMNGSETWTGQVDGTGEVAGNIKNSAVLGATGSGIHTLTADIDGIGSGTLRVRVAWTRVELDVTGEGTVVGGTEDFADATGTVEIEYVATLSGSTYGGTSITSDGSYTIVLTLPAEGS